MILKVTAYPILLGGLIAAALVAFEKGYSEQAVLIATQAVAFVVVAILERVLPYRPEWSRSHGDVATDLAYFVTTSISFDLGTLASKLPFLYVHVRGLWPSGWPLLVQLAAGLVVSELGVYALHRVQHTGGLLWRIHSIHHSVPRLYFLNTARNHPLDAILSAIVAFGPLVALGASERVLALVMIYQGAHAFFQHSNVDVRLGPLNELLSMAEVHRWHHSRRLEESNANYGQTLLVWDHVFRTRKVPGGEPPVDTGLKEMPWFPRGFFGQSLAPFRWREQPATPPTGT